MFSYRVDLDESQRQLVIMALAHLAVERPGFDGALAVIAGKMDNPKLEMYQGFKESASPGPNPDNVI